MLFSKRKKTRKRTKTRKAAAKSKIKKAVRKKAVKVKAPRKKKIAGKEAAKKAAPALKEKEVLIGKVTHYFPHVKAGAIIIEKGKIAIGDLLHIKGHTTDFKQKVKSMQIDRVPIEVAGAGKEVGILVKSRVRINDRVYRAK